MKVGLKIKIARVQKEYTLEQLAKKTGLNIATLSHIENGKVKPNAMTLNKIAKVLKIDLEDLI